MPVQENEDKRTSEPILADEEELRRQQIQTQQEHETSFQKSGKLLPFLNAKAEHHQSRIDTLNGKIATQRDKIEKHYAKIEKLGAKADRLEDHNKMLKATLGDLPLVQKLIAANEKRIDEIRNDRIPNRTQKLVECENKIMQFQAKKSRISHKLDRVVALSDAIKSFSISFNKERREVFSDAMDRLNQAVSACLVDKKADLVEKRADLYREYNQPETSMTDKLALQDKIDSLSDRIRAVDAKIDKLDRPENHFAEQTNESLDAATVVTAEKLSEMITHGTVTMPDLSESMLSAAHSVEAMTYEQQAHLADTLVTANVEMQVEDDYNMIDGIINNGSKEELLKEHKELSETLDSMKDIVGNKHIAEWLREDVARDIPKIESDLAKIETALSILGEENPNIAYEENIEDVHDLLMDMVADGRAEVNDDGTFRENPDYYKELPRNDRHIESMTEAQAFMVMSALDSAGIEFSAAKKGADKVSITVSKKDLVALNDIMYSAIGKIAQTEAAKENAGKGEKGRYQTINPEYYASLSKEHRHSRVESREVAREIVKELMAEKIPYSAVVRQNDTVAITVSKDNAQAYKQIESKVKGERAAEYINPEFYKALPEEFRVTLPMTEEQAKAKVAELDKKGIANSAVLNGDKSAVTVSKKDQARAFFTRSKLKKEVERVSKRTKSSPMKQKNNQEL